MSTRDHGALVSAKRTDAISAESLREVARLHSGGTLLRFLAQREWTNRAGEKVKYAEGTLKHALRRMKSRDFDAMMLGVSP